MIGKNFYLLVVLVGTFCFLSCSDNTEAVNEPPKCSFVTPVTNYEYLPGDSILFSIDVSDFDGTIKDVEFLFDNESVGVVRYAPFSLSYQLSDSLNIGKHYLKAIVKDNDESTAICEREIRVYEEVEIEFIRPDSTSIISSGFFDFYWHSDIQSDLVKLDLYKNDEFIICLSDSVNNNCMKEYMLPEGLDQGAGYRFKVTSIGEVCQYGYSENYTYDKELWRASYDFDDLQNINEVVKTSDGGYFFVGNVQKYSPNNYNPDFIVVKTDNYGHEQWHQKIEWMFEDIAFSAIETSNGDFIAIGITSSYGAGYTNALVVKYDLYGNEVWKKIYGGYNDSGQEINIIEKQNGNFIFARGDNVYEINCDGELVETIDVPTYRISRIYLNNNNDVFLSTDFGSLYKLNSNGEISWELTLSGSIKSIQSLYFDSNDDIIFQFKKYDENYSYTNLLYKVSSDGEIIQSVEIDETNVSFRSSYSIDNYTFVFVIDSESYKHYIRVYDTNLNMISNFLVNNFHNSDIKDFIKIGDDKYILALKNYRQVISLNRFNATF
ncbi:MAG: hypothetical protein JXR48_14665 [Candidatus Delongbacteria bacterium]|nr:hypothetical protein [Candidatus Delongbacteria bacterium]MBN2836199.1 hypothetical protein [Candidatus Delongbacteria bacterium]